MPEPQLPLTLDGVRASGRFMKGIAASPEDVTSCKAVFSAGPNARPLDVDIPQYAMYEDKETGEHSLHVITQAEEANGFRLIGALRASDGTQLAGFESDFQFLGQVPPA